MTVSKYNQLKKRLAWLGLILDYCDGKEVSSSSFQEAVKSAKHFQADTFSKVIRYENKQGGLYVGEKAKN